MDGGNTEPGENDAAGESGISVYPKWPLADSQSLLTGGQLTQCYG